MRACVSYTAAMSPPPKRRSPSFVTAPQKRVNARAGAASGPRLGPSRLVWPAQLCAVKHRTEICSYLPTAHKELTAPLWPVTNVLHRDRKASTRPPYALGSGGGCWRLFVRVREGSHPPWRGPHELMAMWRSA